MDRGSERDGRRARLRSHSCDHDDSVSRRPGSGWRRDQSSGDWSDAFFLKLFFASSSNSPRVTGFGGNIKAGGFDNPLLWLGLLIAPAVAFVIYRTPFGLRVRAAGEHPQAAESVGVSVKRVRYLAVAISGILAGLGGVYLALDQHQFTDQMTAGRGFIAISAVIFGRWNPIRAALACLLLPRRRRSDTIAGQSRDSVSVHRNDSLPARHHRARRRSRQSGSSGRARQG